ncbi:MAG: hypothetical protein IKO53_03820 [Lachnospiraceae bacterium]|nr:hypothetical protein [Lachnospiraceae bacterium]
MAEENLSKSKKKRLAIEKARQEQKQKKAMAIAWAVFIPALIVVIIMAAVLFYQSTLIDYSRYLTNAGTIKGVKDGDVTVDIDALSFSKAELLPDDATVEADIESMLKSHEYISEDAGLKADHGDRVNVSYTSSIDGVSYNEALAADGGEDMVIDEEKISAEFDSALVGHKKGDSFSVKVAFADDDPDPARAGKTAVYEVTLEGIYVTPELNDEFVAANTEYATVAEYRQSIIDSYYDRNLRSAISSSLSENSAVNAYPEKYIDNLTKVYNDQYEKQLESYKQYFGSDLYGSVYEMAGYTDQASYDAMLRDRAREDTAYAMELEYVFKQSGLTNTEDEVRQYYADQGMSTDDIDSAVEAYGRGYLAQAALQSKAMDYLVENVTITD